MSEYTEFTPQHFENYSSILMCMIQIKHSSGSLRDLFRTALEQALDKMDMVVGIQVLDLIYEGVTGTTSEKEQMKAEFAVLVANQDLEKVKGLVRFIADK